jgi:hypothetical protein
MNFTFDENIVSDLHKDAYGFRPTAGWWDCWNHQDNDGKQAAWNTLLEDHATEMESAANAEVAAINAFELEIVNALDVGASSREDAVRWIVQGLELSDNDLMYGGSYICFLKGLPYRMAAMFDNAINFFRAEVA